MAPETAAASRATSTGSSSPKARYLRAFEQEHATTLKVLRAFPADKADFKPHERSNSALMLAWTFVVEESLMLRAITGQQILGSGFPTPPDSWDGVMQALDKGYNDIIAAFNASNNDSLDGTATFFTGPKQTGEYPLETFLWFMLHDQIHHRGQLSVYVRMAGGKVPSIYGPSADEPWR